MKKNRTVAAGKGTVSMHRDEDKKRWLISVFVSIVSLLAAIVALIVSGLQQ